MTRGSHAATTRPRQRGGRGGGGGGRGGRLWEQSFAAFNDAREQPLGGSSVPQPSFPRRASRGWRAITPRAARSWAGSRALLHLAWRSATGGDAHRVRPTPAPGRPSPSIVDGDDRLAVAGTSSTRRHRGLGAQLRDSWTSAGRGSQRCSAWIAQRRRGDHEGRDTRARRGLCCRRGAGGTGHGLGQGWGEGLDRARRASPRQLPCDGERGRAACTASARRAARPRGGGAAFHGTDRASLDTDARTACQRTALGAAFRGRRSPRAEGPPRWRTRWPYALRAGPRGGALASPRRPARDGRVAVSRWW
jgi:hypothetical protein